MAGIIDDLLPLPGFMEWFDDDLAGIPFANGLVLTILFVLYLIWVNRSRNRRLQLMRRQAREGDLSPTKELFKGDHEKPLYEKDPAREDPTKSMWSSEEAAKLAGEETILFPTDNPTKELFPHTEEEPKTPTTEEKEPTTETPAEPEPSRPSEEETTQD